MTPIKLMLTFDRFFTRSKSGAIWGRIYFEIGDGQFFPSNEWTDLVAAFMRGWLWGLLQIADGAATEESVPFYDGPFSVKVSANRAGVLGLSFVGREVVTGSATAGIKSLLQEAATITEQLLAHCQEKEWNNDDIEALPLLLARAERIARVSGPT